jgi:Mor family transcriptional regulator
MGVIKFVQIEGEIWKDIAGFEGLYEVSNFQRVKALEKFRKRPKGAISFREASILRQTPSAKGYLSVTLTDKDGRRHQKRVHVLIAQAFIPNPLNLPEVNHKYGDKKDNRIEMLEWNTHLENMQHAVATGLYTQIGENHFKNILKESQVLEIFNSPLTYKELSKKYGVAKTTIQAIKTGKNWKQLTGKNYQKKNIKLTKEQIIEIFNSTKRRSEIAKIYSITKDHVGRIKRGVVHSDITHYQ